MRDQALHSYEAALRYLETRQLEGGAFAGEVIWNPMLVCQYVVVCHILGRPISEERKQRIRLSLEQQVRDDDGWGMHPNSESWLFHTALGYVTLRLLGHPPTDPLVAGAGKWIQRHGGVYAVPTWGRIWLAVLGLYPWSGVQPILPELWLLPEPSPFHPSRLYCHMRLIYLGVSYLYGHRFVTPPSVLLDEIRSELYPAGYDVERFEQHRDEIAATDLFEQRGAGLRAAFGAMRAVERMTPGSIRKRALAHCYEHILFEFRSTNYVCLSPVNGLFFCLGLHVTNPAHPDLDPAVAGLEYWFWEDDEDGARVCGARSDIWDTSFLIQALCEGPASPTAETLVESTTAWLPLAQIQEEIVGGDRHYREPAYGGWGFANENHPWPVSDCTAEALEALMRAERTGLSGPAGRLQLGRKLAAVEFVLRRQNNDGGFGSYEPRRGSMVIRHFNPAEIYGNCMLEYSYTECTGSCIRGLANAERELGDDLPPQLRAQIREAVHRGCRFILHAQDQSGGWAGFWGINFTYGTMFAVSGLLAAGTSRSHPAIVRGCRWLVENQRPDGGWGEDWRGMLSGTQVDLPEGEPSLSVQTAWALLTLLEAAPHEAKAIEQGVRYLIDRQDPSGGWPSERASGCFFNTAVLDYAMYKNIFTTWALARYLGHAAKTSA